MALRHYRLPLPDARAAVVDEAVPVLRGLLLALYTFTFLHKLNWGFLTPATSCAGFMAPPGGAWVKTTVMWTALAVEGGIPLLLAIPRTRRLAMLLAWPFHFALAFHPRPGIYAFSSMLLAMLTLFLPAGFYATLSAHPIVQRVTRSAARRRFFWPRLVAAGVDVVTLAGGAIALSGVDIGSTPPEAWSRRFGMLLWMPYPTALLAGLLLGWPAVRGARAPAFC